MAATTRILAGDIGGTKTRLGLYTDTRPHPDLWAEKTYASGKASDLKDILADFLDQHNQTIHKACLGIAGPVDGGRARVTNLPWEIAETELRTRFKIKNVRLLNDLSAVAHAIPRLENTDWIYLNRGKRRLHDPVGIIAPGTGLGIALLVRQKGDHIVLPSEGGHTDFAPTTKEQCSLWQYLNRQFGHVSIERLISGSGIFHIYSWLRDSRGEVEPDWLAEKLPVGDPAKVITDAALARNDPICTETLEIFVTVLGAAAGNLALLGLTRGGIYIGGGIAPHILDLLQNGLFMSNFIAKGRFSKLLENIPVRVILNTKLPMFGAAVYASEYL